jgi:phosphoglycerate dehydrogenase-like enzyme
VAFYDPYLVHGYEKAIGVRRYDDVDEILAKSDIITIHTPLTNDTHSMVDSAFLHKMKSGASLINTARGEIIADLDTLFDAMITEHIYSIALDVLPTEPTDECRLINAWRSREPISSRILINPHTAYYSTSAYKEMRYKASANAKRIITGDEPINIISDGQ